MLKRRFHLLSLLILCIFCLTPTPGNARADIKYLTPPVVTIELSGREPAPSNLPANLEWGGGGGPTDEPEFGRGIYWVYRPKFSYPNSVKDNIGNSNITLTACGYAGSSGPRGSLTFPSGQTISHIGQTYDNDCWIFGIDGYYGMELGTYALRLSHSVKTLSHTWQIDYPREKTFTVIDKDGVELKLIMGFKPFESVPLYFYAANFTQGKDYVASRNITVDENGAAVLALQISRSAPYTIRDVVFIINEKNQNGDFIGSSILMKPSVEINCPGFMLASRMYIGNTARVTPATSANLLNSKPSRPSLDRSSKALAKIPVGGKFTIIGGPTCNQEILWWQIKYKGTIGWTGEGTGYEYWIESDR
jgi:hypothetical protein